MLYSGNFYTPTDVKFPFEKVDSIIQQLNPKFIITAYKSANKLLEHGMDRAQMIFVDDIDFKKNITVSDVYLNKIIDTDLAYVFLHRDQQVCRKELVFHREVLSITLIGPEKKINFIFWVPSALINVANSGLLESVDCSSIKKILFAGEVMPNKYLNYWRRFLPDAVYANLYGPAEIAVFIK